MFSAKGIEELNTQWSWTVLRAVKFAIFKSSKHPILFGTKRPSQNITFITDKRKPLILGRKWPQFKAKINRRIGASGSEISVTTPD